MFPHSDICGYIAYLQLPAAFRSLSRPSSAPDAKAFTLCSFSLELIVLLFIFLNCLSFFKQIRSNQAFYSLIAFPPLGEIVCILSNALPLERPNQFLNFVLFYICSFLLIFQIFESFSLFCCQGSRRFLRLGRSGWTRTIDLALIRRAL